MSEQADVVIIGAGAAGLMAGIFVGRTNPARKIVLLDGAKKIGAKILVSGGGRCNVTHDRITEEAYAGTSRNAIKKVLRRFEIPQTISFFREIGVELKREETGKLFPVTDEAQTVLNALLDATRDAGVPVRHPRRVHFVERQAHSFRISGEWGSIDTQRVVMATGGKSLPKTGSDGYGYEIAQSLGHQITKRVFPALVPLTLPRDHFICGLSGITLPTTLELHTSTGKKLTTFTDSTLCTHFGLSGPSVLDISRYYLDAVADDAGTQLVINWLPETTPESFEKQLQSAGKSSLLRVLNDQLPERLIRALAAYAGIDVVAPVDQFTREQRKRVVQTVTQLPLPITDSRGYTYAEVTAGGVPLSEIRLETMESRVCPGLYFCGEICDVDGRIGGYNFQWAWASGYVVGVSV
jgi:predicted Rossmann fold flavoprotein